MQRDITTKTDALNDAISKSNTDLTKKINDSNQDLTDKIEASNTELTTQISESNADLTKKISDSKSTLESNIEKTREDLYTEIGKQIAKVSSLSIDICENELPTENISEFTIYLVKPSNLPSNASENISVKASTKSIKSVQSTPTVKPQVFSLNGEPLYREYFVKQETASDKSVLEPSVQADSVNGNLADSLKSSLTDAQINAQATVIPEDEYYIACFWVKTGEDTHKWVAVGTTKIDLSQYSTTEEMNAAISKAVEDMLKKITDEEVTFKVLPKVPYISGKTDYENEQVASVGFVNDSQINMVNELMKLINAKPSLIEAFDKDEAVTLSTLDPNNLYYTTDVGIPIKSFAEATMEEINKYLEWHYEGKINLSEHWNVGDTKTIHLNATESSENASCAHAEQEMTLVILDFDHDDLVEQIFDKTKAAVTIGFREIMANNGEKESEYIWGQSKEDIADTDVYTNNPLRTFLNDELILAMPIEVQDLIKQVNKKNLVYHTKSDEAPTLTQDKVFLLSYPEVYGTTTESNYLNGGEVGELEGTQYEYMKTEENRKKYLNNNGTPSETAEAYWLRSPSYVRNEDDSNFYMMLAGSLGTASNSVGSNAYGISVAFCL